MANQNLKESSDGSPSDAVRHGDDVQLLDADAELDFRETSETRGSHILACVLEITLSKVSPKYDEKLLRQYLSQ